VFQGGGEGWGKTIIQKFLKRKGEGEPDFGETRGKVQEGSGRGVRSRRRKDKEQIKAGWRLFGVDG